jgi:hypothetical protein
LGDLSGNVGARNTGAQLVAHSVTRRDPAAFESRHHKGAVCSEVVNVALVVGAGGCCAEQGDCSYRNRGNPEDRTHTGDATSVTNSGIGYFDTDRQPV